ncbi:hypothetical protein JOF41_007378 [Saccharothrix coeruleofusca]|uniref:hypothetical protein n=1 Tax=Saccharothrix coeruleofusca TaxID=33919 RepID=UPI001AE1895B|nr:hypothetical protein [Saccharothrix coeruleofusca]MBP2341124.1 hypothetical protein [Saccharothrix coeruleofusca]
MKTYRFDQYREDAAIEPYVLEVDEQRSITIPAPSTDTILKLEETSSTRERLMLLCGEHADEVFGLLKDESMHVMVRFVMDLAKHYGVDLQRVPVGGTGASSS